ncbi:PHM/PNGase F domain-containing protein [Haematococcus lacustris]
MVQQPAGRVQQGIAGAQVLVPLATVPLFEGGSFDATYNNRSAMAVTVPSGAVKAIIMAVISGHGSDDNNCAEFCPTSHHFTVNGVEEHVASFDTAGSAWGCSQEVRRGALPNEHGTWFYGRNGWCDGQQVRPWLADVSAQLPASPSAWMASKSPDPLPRQQGGRAGQENQAGQAGEVGQQGQQGKQAGQGWQGGRDLLGFPGQLVISYQGLFKGRTPAPLPGSDPHIMMSSSITFWGSPGQLPS